MPSGVELSKSVLVCLTNISLHSLILSFLSCNQKNVKLYSYTKTFSIFYAKSLLSSPSDLAVE